MYIKFRTEPYVRLNVIRFCHWLHLISRILLWDALLPTGILYFLIYLSEARKYSKQVTQLSSFCSFFTLEKYIKIEEMESCKWFSYPRHGGSMVLQNGLCLKEQMHRYSLLGIERELLASINNTV